jgi:hypothetical protein
LLAQLKIDEDYWLDQTHVSGGETRQNPSDCDDSIFQQGFFHSNYALTPDDLPLNTLKKGINHISTSLQGIQ